MSSSPPPTPPTGATGAIREITDPQAMRALAHPVRMALLETLRVDAPLTATEAGERIDESPTTCSFHLRQLAKYGFVEEAGGGKGRSRPWQLTTSGFRFSSEQESPEAEIAAAALASLFRERQLRRLQTWLETRRSYPRSWREAATSSALGGWMTPEELAALNDEVIALIRSRIPDRAADPDTRPEGALPVELLLYSYPRTPPEGGLT